MRERYRESACEKEGESRRRPDSTKARTELGALCHWLAYLSFSTVLCVCVSLAAPPVSSVLFPAVAKDESEATRRARAAAYTAAVQWQAAASDVSQSHGVVVWWWQRQGQQRPLLNRRASRRVSSSFLSASLIPSSLFLLPSSPLFLSCFHSSFLFLPSFLLSFLLPSSLLSSSLSFSFLLSSHLRLFLPSFFTPSSLLPLPCYPLLLPLLSSLIPDHTLAATAFQNLLAAANGEVFDQLVAFCRNASAPPAPGTLASPFNEVPTALLLTGINTPDHDPVFARLVDRLKVRQTAVGQCERTLKLNSLRHLPFLQDVTEHCILLRSRECKGIRGVMKSLVQKAMGLQVMHMPVTTSRFNSVTMSSLFIRVC